ncbi:MAG TPA: hypothetical protein PLO57_01350 [Candidatus Cloacimonadota bacterium]|nr:hypothetical protein [Candidatus Cloacimonadota bacterium]
MFWLSLLSGALASFSPFLGMIVVMIFCARTLGSAIVSPQRALFAFFVIPLALLLIDRSPANQLMVLDAIFGVGIIAWVFLITLRANQVLSEALLISAIALMVYSLARMFLFGAFLTESFDQGFELLQAQVPALVNTQYMDLSMKLWKMIMPSMWGVGQILALLVGYYLFHKTIKIPFRFEDLKFPALYNLLIVAILPLYLVDAGRLIFINALILLCMIPLTQGFASVSVGLAKVIASDIVRGIIMVIVLLYAFIPLTLIGLADSWLGIRTNNRGGNTA